ncbi:MAG TPA: Crp/Fnr family transcriptional regulator [Actinomycetota bacterium]|jgi:CRP-like cAMP-binding protein
MAEPLRREPLPLTYLTVGRIVVCQGDPASRPLVVVSGALEERCLSSDGRELVLAILGPGDLATPPQGRPSHGTVRAVRVARVREALPREIPALLAARAERSSELACDLAWLDVAGRLERRLDDLANRFGRAVEGGVLIDLFLTQSDLAALVGASREHVNRALGSLDRSGRIRRGSRGRYVVRPALRSVGA